MGFKGKVAIAFGLASAILIGVAVLSYRRMVQTETDETWVAHTHYVREELEAFFADLAEAEANQHGYIITNDARNLTTYQYAVARLGKRSENLHDLTLDNPVQQIWLSQLNPLVTARLTQMRAAIGAHRANGEAAGIAVVRDNNGGDTMAKARTIIDAMSREEDRLLNARTSAAKLTLQRMKGVILRGYVIAFVFLFAASLLIHHEMENRKIADEAVAQRRAELEVANKELEAFCYSVSHDLRAPLRGIDGFSQALLEEYSGQLGPVGINYLERVRAGTQRMATLIDDLLNLSRITRAEIRWESTDLTEIAQSVTAALRENQPERHVEVTVAPRLASHCDPRLIRVVLENLLGNAWKFTSKKPQAQIEFGRMQNNGSSAFYVKDNGAGFDPQYASRLFGAFQRLHSAADFPGTGVGLASVERIIHRHGGRIWAEGKLGQGATFYFTL